MSALEILCPACFCKLDIISFPTLEESIEYGDEEERKSSEALLIRRNNYKVKCLKNPDQLLDIEIDNFVLIWDIEDTNDGEVLLIKLDNNVIWREPTYFESYERYMTICDILINKYGNSLKDVIPTERSHLFLYGDSISSPEKIIEYRKKIAKKK